MNKIYFAMALHFHQPVGNFENIIQRAHDLCYRPFLDILGDYPDIKMTFHVSGCLLDYFQEKNPDTMDLIKRLVSKKQIEIMSGGYYEPILSAIPQNDATSQIRMMSEYIKKKFNFTPLGMWIPERVWEEKLTRLIYNAGMRYTILDDAHFLRSGVKKEDMHGYFLTGHAKEKIAIFPSDKRLRYTIPFKLPHETIDYFRAESENKKDPLFTYGDDGEKFGEWPGTHKWVFEEQWLKKFFDILCENRDWINLVHLSDYLKNNKPKSEIEIKPGSYEEMMEWTNGSWMNFLKKYPETNQMQKRMFYISKKVNLTDSKDAKKELYKGQCNCGYWHGVFGGLYLYNLRSAIYSHLIKAEKIADDLSHKGEKDWLDIKQIDFDSDGKKEVFIENETFSLCIAPDEGGTLKELDFRPYSVNLINTLSRKKEAYHEKILYAACKENNVDIATIHDDFRTVNPALKEKLSYDKFPRYCLRNYFIKPSGGETGDFATADYRVKIIKKTLTLEYESPVLDRNIKLTKSIQIKSKKEIEVIYNIEKKSKGSFCALFVVEFNVTMPYLNSERYNYFYGNKIQGPLNTKGAAHNADVFGISDSEKSLGIMLNFSIAPEDILYFPVETVSQSERAYELHFQCSCISPHFKLNLNKNSRRTLKISWQMV